MHATRNFPPAVQSHANRVIAAVAEAHGVLLSDIIIGAKARSSRKDGIAQARAEAVRRLRASIVQNAKSRRAGDPVTYAVRNPGASGPGPGWAPLSMVSVAELSIAFVWYDFRLCMRGGLTDPRRGHIKELLATEAKMVLTRIYEIRHRLSRYGGCWVRCLTRPSPKHRPNNVLVEELWTGEQWSCPWRGLRRKQIEVHMTEATR